MNPYKTLNSKPSDDLKDIKKRYRKLVNKFHPDKKGGDPEKFHEIQQAWEVINNPERICFYDIFGDSITPEDIGVVMSQLENNFISCMDANNPIKVMTKTSESALKMYRERIDECQIKINKLDNKKNKIKTTLKTNIFINFLDRVIAQQKAKIESIEHEIDITTKCLLVLENYEWIQDLASRSRNKSEMLLEAFEYLEI